MMTVDVSNGRLDITLSSWDRIWALKRHISVPPSSIKSVEITSPPRETWKTLRAPGTHWPGKITAGSYWNWETKEWSFWNIRKSKRVVVIEIEGEKYKRLVLEVGDPEGLVDRVSKATT